MSNLWFSIDTTSDNTNQHSLNRLPITITFYPTRILKEEPIDITLIDDTDFFVPTFNIIKSSFGYISIIIGDRNFAEELILTFTSACSLEL